VFEIIFYTSAGESFLSIFVSVKGLKTSIIILAFYYMGSSIRLSSSDGRTSIILIKLGVLSLL
jgi:hypothetical protein